eukprot:Lithocolla_globosa_v1_NODE_103_length_6349_cov_4.180489.p5 type:complete len:127 gc:universal NODE_103_length_6349_cov_4.180489:630-1010(+)
MGRTVLQIVLQVNGTTAVVVNLVTVLKMGARTFCVMILACVIVERISKVINVTIVMKVQSSLFNMIFTPANLVQVYVISVGILHQPHVALRVFHQSEIPVLKINRNNSVACYLVPVPSHFISEEQY